MTAVPAALDLRDPAVVATALGALNRRLEREASTPRSVVATVEEMVDAIARRDEQELAAVNPWTWIAIQGAALRAQAALHERDPHRRRALRLALEQMRFLFARLADRRPVGEDRPAADIARWLEEALPGIAQAQKARLLGVGPRTYQRWLSRDSRPGGSDERRLRVVARLVNQLRHSLTGPGVVDWFEHPRADLGGDRPLELLAEPERLEELVAAAAASRGNVAA